ncbi:MAG: DNA-binding protein [Halolamina sp.]
MTNRTINPETRINSNSEEAVECPHCGRPFTDDRPLALHVGETHRGTLDSAEEERYESAREAEDEDLFIFHLKMVVVLGILYAAVVLGYMITIQTL